MKRITRNVVILTQLLMTVNMTATAQHPGKYAPVNGLHMYYEIHGTGNPLVLIHGGGSTIISNWGLVLPYFARTHKVIAVELQAHGRTADNGRVTTFEQDADDVAELLKQLNISDADIVGFSNGGNTAMQMAIRHPELVHKIVIASAFYKRDGLIAGFWDGMNNATLENMPQGLKDAYIKVAPRPQDLPIMFERDARRMINFKDWNEGAIRSIRQPALVVIGSNDIVTPEHAVDMYRLLPRGTLCMLPGLHGEYLGEVEVLKKGSRIPELFVAMVNEFLGNL